MKKPDAASGVNIGTGENENTVPEKPATHNKQAQRWLFLVGGVFLLCLIVATWAAFLRAPAQLGKKKAREAGLVNVVAPQDSEADFQRQLKREEERRARVAAEGEKATEPPSQALERLRAARAEAAEIAALPPSERAEATQQQADRRAGRGQSKVQKTPLEQWEEKEMLRVLNSRASALKVQVVNATAPSGSKPSGSTPTRGTPARSVGAQRTDGTDSSIAQEQASVQAELARVEALKRKLQGGESTAEDIAAEMGAGYQQTAFSNAAESTRQPTAQPRAAQRGPGQVVGKPAAAAAPEPGQKHLPISTVARAVLDQQLISDYNGSFRCMFIDDVYDATKRYIMIPKGSRCMGTSARVSNVNEPIQARAGLLVDRIILPDKSTISMDRKIALDAEGVSAIKDKVNRHFLAQFLGVAAYAVLSSESSYEGSGSTNDDTFEGELSENLRSQFSPLAQKYLNLVPTITLRPGTPMRIFFEDDIYAYPWSSVSSDIVSQVRTPGAR